MLRTSAMRVQVVGDGHKPLLTSGASDLEGPVAARVCWENVNVRRPYRGENAWTKDEGGVGRSFKLVAENCEHNTVEPLGCRRSTAGERECNSGRVTSSTNATAARSPTVAGCATSPAGEFQPSSLDLADVRNDCSYGRAPRCARHPARLEADGSASIIPGHQHPKLRDWQGSLARGTLFAAGCCTDGPQRRIDGECRVGLIT